MSDLPQPETIVRAPEAMLEEGATANIDRSGFLQGARDSIGEPIIWEHPTEKDDDGDPVEYELAPFSILYQKWWATLRQWEGGSSMGEVQILIYLLTNKRKREIAKAFRRTKWEDVVVLDEDDEPELDENDSPVYERELIRCPLLDEIDRWAEKTFENSQDMIGAQKAYAEVFNRTAAARAIPVSDEEDDDDTNASKN